MIIFTEKLLTNTTGNIISLAIYAYLSNRAPLTYFTDGGGGGGLWGWGSPREIFRSEILAQRDFLGSVKDAGIFLGREKKTQGYFWVLYFSSAQINNNVSAIYCWCGIF